jgi:cell division septum initiation protein DivIVA
LSDIYHLIDRLERLLNESWRMPLSTFLVINEDDFLDIVDQMRTAIPQEIKQGEKIQAERERIVAQAEEEAERIVHLAQDDASKLIEGHELIVAAEQRADTVLQRAQREADILKRDADEYVRGVLVSLDQQLGSVDGQIAELLQTVRNGLETLSQPQVSTEDE